MKLEEARAEAQRLANENHAVMAVAHNPYDEDNSEPAEQYGYWPLAAKRIFRLETVVEEVHPNGST